VDTWRATVQMEGVMGEGEAVVVAAAAAAAAATTVVRQATYHATVPAHAESCALSCRARS